MDYLLIGGTILLLSLSIWGVIRFFRFLEEKNIEAETRRDIEEKKILDRIETVANSIVRYRGDWAVSKPEVHRKHDQYLLIRELNCDEVNALVSPSVAIQFNSNSREVELRLYVKEFYRSGSYSKSLAITRKYSLLLCDQIAEKAIELYEYGFEPKVVI